MEYVAAFDIASTSSRLRLTCVAPSDAFAAQMFLDHERNSPDLKLVRVYRVVDGRIIFEPISD